MKRRQNEGIKGRTVPTKRVVEPEVVDESDSDNDELDSEVDEVEVESEEIDDDEESSEEESDDEFEKQSSSSEDEDYDNNESEKEEDDAIREAETKARAFGMYGRARASLLEGARKDGSLNVQQHLHVDDLSSDDEDVTGNNTIGRVPLHWYDAYDHIGYDIQGTKVMKRSSGKSKIDEFLASHDPSMKGSHVVYDAYNDREVVLSSRDIELIRRIQAGAYAHPEFNDQPDYVDYASSEREIMPISAAPDRKSSFVPSKHELQRVLKIAQAMNQGTYVDIATQRRQKWEKNNPEPLKEDTIWKEGEEEDESKLSQRQAFHLPAPKLPLPGHAESYNPPPEYLLTPEEEQEWESHRDPLDRDSAAWKPQSYACLRHVPSYPHFVQERFQRCLDLYLAPRQLKKRLNIDPEALVPQLPRPRELKPYPNYLSMQYLAPESLKNQDSLCSIRALAVSPDGQYLVTGNDDSVVQVWEVDSGYCRHHWSLQRGPILQVQWSPLIPGLTQNGLGGLQPAPRGADLIMVIAGCSLIVIAMDTSVATATATATATAASSSSSTTTITTNTKEEVQIERQRLLTAIQELASNNTSTKARKNDKDDEENDSGISDASSDEDNDDDDKKNTKKAGNKDSLGQWKFFHNNAEDKDGKPENSGKKIDTNNNTNNNNNTKKKKNSTHSSSSSSEDSPRMTMSSVGPLLELVMPAEIAGFAWHYKGDYFATLCPSMGTNSVIVHQLSKAQSQCPFTSSPGAVQSLQFHPTRPFLFVVTQQHVKVYHLLEQKLVKKLLSGCKWLSSIHIHPSGDHVLVGSYDRRVVWFDLDLASTPFKTLKYHEKAVRKVVYHNRYPLMASCSDDGTIHVFHCMVYNDMSKDPLIVPLKVLRGHGAKGKNQSIYSIAFHPQQPWLFSTGADGVVNLFQDI